MIIGIPKETKIHEYRVAMTPEGVGQLVSDGSLVLIEKGAGIGSGFSDRLYCQMGGRILSGRRDIFGESDLILKVKEPNLQEIKLFKKGQTLFTFLHLAANLPVMRGLLRKKIRAIGYETVQTDSGDLPILAPMSQIAGSMAALLAANYLRKDLGGKGIILPGVGGRNRGKALILGLGHVGKSAASALHGLGAEVYLFDINKGRGRELAAEFGDRGHLVERLSDISTVVSQSDVVIGAVLLPGKKAPRLVSKKMVKSMSHGSVIVDVSIDQGGCVEGMGPTTLKDPVYLRHGVLHCGVTNLPSLAARSATIALSEKTLPYVRKMARQGVEAAIRIDPSLARGLNLRDGEIVHPALLSR